MNAFDMAESALESLFVVAYRAWYPCQVASLWAALILAVVVVLQTVLGRKLSAAQHAWLWGIVLVRLVIPYAPVSPLSLQNLFAHEVPAVVGAEAERQLVTEIIRDEIGAYDPAGPSKAPPAVVPIESSLAEDLLEFAAVLWPPIWLCAAVGSLSWTLASYARLSLRVHQAPRSVDRHLKQLWEACCETAGVRVRIPVVHDAGMTQPALMGWYRPVLLWPQELQLEDEQLRMVFLHELAHVRRGDVLANWLLIVVRAVHWWNPVYWVAARRYRSLREQACDAFVIEQLQGGVTRAYSELILSLSQRQPRGSRWRVMLPAPLLGFASFWQTRAIGERLRALQCAGRQRGRWQSALAAGLLLLVALAGLTDARATSAPVEEAQDWLPLAAHELESAPEPADGTSAHLYPVTYDAAKALERIGLPPRTREGALLELELMVKNLLRYSGRAGLDVATASPSPATASNETEDSDVAAKSVSIEGTQMIVSANARQHAEIARNLRAWEINGLSQICLETRIIRDSRDLASAFGAAWRYVDSPGESQTAQVSSNGDSVHVNVRSGKCDYVPIAVAALNPAQTRALVQVAQSDRRANVLSAPKITMFNGQQASIQDCSQTPFVVGIRDLPGGAQEPRIKIYEEGTKVTLRIEPSPTAGVHHLEGRIEMSGLGEVLTPPTVMAGQPAHIQIPQSIQWSVDVAGDVADGHSLLVACVPNCREKRFLYVLLTPRKICD